MNDTQTQVLLCLGQILMLMVVTMHLHNPGLANLMEAFMWVPSGIKHNGCPYITTDMFSACRLHGDAGTVILYISFSKARL